MFQGLRLCDGFQLFQGASAERTSGEEEEERITKGETRSFTLRIHFPWHVKITKEDNPEYAPYRYTLNAYCLDNPQCFNRRYTTLEKALLHCLNGFNENAAIKDRYHSIGEYLLQK